MTGGQPDPGFRYWAFISYSHADTAWARWLHKSLETYRVPSRLIGMPIAAGRVPPRLSPIFRDRDELPTATDLGQTIEEALRQSWCLIVICSRASAQSRWVNEEVLAFQRLGRAARIHCLIVDGAPDAAASPCYPPALLEAISGTHAPIAADARTDGDGKTNAKLKLIAGMLGVGFDKLVQREQQRRHRSMLVTTVASLLAVVALSVFSIITITSRRDAEAQRRHAEGLVEFMLGDLRQKLEPDGKLATLDAVGKEALAYYAAQDPESLDADALARRARALQQIGEVYNLRGRLDDALGVFKQAEQTTAELLEREPDNGTRIFDHAQSVFWVGYVAYQRDNIGVAEPQFQLYKTLAERLVAIDPGNEDWQAEVGFANSNLGTLLWSQGRSAEAAAVFDRELEMARALSRKAPAEFTKQMRTSQAHAWLATTLFAQSRFMEASTHRNAEIAIYQDALSRDPRNKDAKEGLSSSERALANILLCMGDMDRALAHIRRAVHLADELVAEDPEHSRWLEYASAAYLLLADVLHSTALREDARAATKRARDYAGQLVQRDPAVSLWQTLWARSMLLEAEQVAGEGRLLEATRLAQGGLQRMEDLPALTEHSPARDLIMAELLVFLGIIYTEQAQDQDAHAAMQRVVSLLPGSKSGRNPGADAVSVVALYALGRSEEAQPIAARLAAAGYREPRYSKSLETFRQPVVPAVALDVQP